MSDGWWRKELRRGVRENEVSRKTPKDSNWWNWRAGIRSKARF